MRRLLPLLSTVAALAALPAPAVAADPPPGSEYEEVFFDTGDPEIRSLHADILRPAGLPKDAKAPVIMTVSPYTNHSGDTGTSFDPSKSGPSDRFYDFLEVGKVFEKGYIYVMVDLPGTGGSDGCNDWGGPVEQRGVKHAVEWAAKQPWSNGKVALMGKSYDGWTGLMGIAQKPQGLAAVLSMEPVYSGYRYYFTNGVHLGSRSALTTASFQVNDAKPGSTSDSPQYHYNSAPKAYCYGVNEAGSQTDTEDSAFWAPRNLLPVLKGKDTPLFLTQGFLETNTAQDGAFDVFNGMTGAKRAWFGQFDHVRGWEGCKDGECQMGRTEFAAEMMRFLDHYLKGAPPHGDPTVFVQSAPDGRYRTEPTWPPTDSVSRTSPLKVGTYTDDGTNNAYGSNSGNGVWTFSQSLPYKVHMAGEPVLAAQLTGVPQGNFVVNLYDVAPDGKATHVSRSAWLMRSNSEDVSFKLYGQDWIFEAGHRIGVLLSSSNADWWLHAPTRASITVEQATIAIPWLTYERTEFASGGMTSRLQGHLEVATLTVEPGKFAEGESQFDLPAKLAPMPRRGTGPTSTKLTLKAKVKKRRLTISGTAPVDARVKLTVKLGRKTVKRKTVTAKRGRYRMVIKLKKRGRYSVGAVTGTQKASKKVKA